MKQIWGSKINLKNTVSFLFYIRHAMHLQIYISREYSTWVYIVVMLTNEVV